MEQEVQTDEVQVTERWCQYPPEDMRGCGSE